MSKRALMMELVRGPDRQLAAEFLTAGCLKLTTGPALSKKAYVKMC